MTTANILSQLGSPGVSTGFKNRIINGAMVIDQRNAGASKSVDNTYTYTLDRWAAEDGSDGVFTIQQDTTAPTGFINSLKFTTTTADSSLASNQYAYIEQNIEGYNVADLGYGTANAVTTTLSFWVRSSLTGTFGGAFVNAAATRSYAFTYTISAANTWEQKSITVAGDTTGTWVTNNGCGLKIRFGLGVGTGYSGTAGSWAAANYISATGATSVIGTLSATWFVTGVQLEVGTTATNFDFRSYGTELALCQRYYQNVGSTIFGTVEGTTTFSIMAPFYFPMRTAPTVASRTGYYFNVRYLGSDTSIVSPTLANVTSTGLSSVWLQVISTGLTNGSVVYGRCQNGIATSTSSYNDFLSVNAEL